MIQRIGAVNFGSNDTQRFEISSSMQTLRFTRDEADEIADLLQRWLAFDPEQELIEQVNKMYVTGPITDATRNIIAAVREHDAKYGKP